MCCGYRAESADHQDYWGYWGWSRVQAAVPAQELGM